MLLTMTCFLLITSSSVVAQRASSQTSDSLRKVDEQIDENVKESRELLTKVMKDYGTSVVKLSGLKLELDNLKQSYDHYILHKTISDPNPQLAQIIGKAAHLVATIIGQAKIPGVSTSVRLGTLTIDQAANVWELNILT